LTSRKEECDIHQTRIQSTKRNLWFLLQQWNQGLTAKASPRPNPGPINSFDKTRIVSKS
jgi:hypothetical protein